MESHQAKNLASWCHWELSQDFPGITPSEFSHLVREHLLNLKDIGQFLTQLFLNGVQLLLALCEPIAKTTFTFNHIFFYTGWLWVHSACFEESSARSGLIPLIIYLSLSVTILFPKHRDLQCGNKHRLSKQFWKIYFFSQTAGILTLFFSV